MPDTAFHSQRTLLPLASPTWRETDVWKMEFYLFWYLLTPSTGIEQLPQLLPLMLLHPHSTLIAPFPLQISFKGENGKPFFLAGNANFLQGNIFTFLQHCYEELLCNVWHPPVWLIAIIWPWQAWEMGWCEICEVCTCLPASLWPANCISSVCHPNPSVMMCLRFSGKPF